VVSGLDIDILEICIFLFRKDLSVYLTN